MSQPIPPDSVRSIFSIIELDFCPPFTERGTPPEHLEDIFTESLSHLEQEEKPEWIQWGADIVSRNRVCIQLGRRVFQNQRYVDPQMDVSTAEGMPKSVELLSPFLTSPPRIRHVQSPDRNEPIRCDPCPWQERQCDVFIIEVPSRTPLYDMVSIEMITLRQDIRRSFSSVVYNNDSLCGDIKSVVLGIDECSDVVGPDPGRTVCQFVLLVYWKSLGAMESFKHPDVNGIGYCGRELKKDWWIKEVLELFKKLEGAGARVNLGTFKMRDFERQSPLIWWVPDLENLRTGPVPGSNKSWQLKLLLYVENKIFRGKQRSSKSKIRWKR